MSLIQIITDFIALGITGAFVTITLLIWWTALEIMVYQQGYFKIIDNRPLIKAVINLTAGITIWGYLLCKVHNLLWTAGTTIPGIAGTIIAGS